MKQKKTPKYTARVAIYKTKSDEYYSYKIILNAKVEGVYYSKIRFDMTAQANVSDPSRVYALKVDSTLDFDTGLFDEHLKLLGKLRSELIKQSAPRACLSTNGTAFLANCELTRLTMACEALDFHVSHFETWSEAYDWSTAVPNEGT